MLTFSICVGALGQSALRAYIFTDSWRFFAVQYLVEKIEKVSSLLIFLVFGYEDSTQKGLYRLNLIFTANKISIVPKKGRL